MAELRIRNPGRFGLVLPPRSGPVDSGNRHLGVFLPAGVLSAVSLSTLAAAGGWELARGERRAGEHRWDALYLAATTPVTIAPGEEVVVALRGVAAEAKGSSRFTRAVIEYDLAAAGPMVGGAVRGSRSLLLGIEPWTDVGADVPVLAALMSGGSVVNRAAVANRVIVGLGATAVGRTVRLLGGRTELRLSWDVGPADTHWWALCDRDQAEACEVSVRWVRDDPDSVRPDLDPQVGVSGSAAMWRAVVPEDIDLWEGEGLALAIDGLVTSHPSGPANLYVTVAGVDGRGTARFVLKLAKQPLAWGDGGGFVPYAGDADELVSVRGEFGQRAAVLAREGPGFNLDVYAADGIQVGARLSSAGRSFVASQGFDISGSLRIGSPSDGHVYSIETEDGGDRLRFDGSTATSGSAAVDHGLTVGGPAHLAAGLSVDGPLRAEARQLLEVVKFRYRFAEFPTGRRVAQWTPLIIGERDVRLTNRRTLETVVGKMTLVARDGEWLVVLERHLGLPLDTPDVVDGDALLTVLFINQALLR